MRKTFSTLLIATLTVLLFTAIIRTEIPVALADTQQNVETITQVTVSSNPVVVAQRVQINVTISPPPPTKDDYFTGIIIKITNPDGDNMTVGPLKASSDWQDKTEDTIWYNYVPSQAGTFKITAYYEGDTFSDGGITYLPSISSTVTLIATWEIGPQSTPKATETPTPTTFTPAPSTTPMPTPTRTPPPTPTPTPQVRKTASFSIETETKDSAVTISGRLYAPGTVGIAVQDIYLSYSVDDKSWMPIGLCMTNEWGKYDYRWVTPPSGTYTLKAKWEGNSEFQPASNTTSIGTIPFENQQAIVQSNSTLTQISYNQTVGLSFTVNGEGGTQGYAKVVIPKNLMPENQNIKVHVDGKPINFDLTSSEDEWIISFTYQHSTHQVVINTATNISQDGPIVLDESMLLIFGAVVAALTAVAGLLVWLAKTGKK
ncbi:MAG: hypothetical protein ACQCN3_00200 [Candidatus Bathyarchaeia archaeon]|jgi:hypothetical protein